MATISDIDSYPYLDVLRISDNEGPLRLEVSAKAIGEDSRLYEVSWPSYLVYQVVDESYAYPDDYDKYQGSRLVKYSQSRYWDFVKSAPSIRFEQAEFDSDGTLAHWGLLCLNHIFDVISKDQPQIRELEPPWEKESVVRARFEEMLARNREESIAATERERKEKAERERGG